MTTWWNKNAETRIDDLKSWIGDFNKPDKIYCRTYVAGKGYKTIIDCGCAISTESAGYKHDNYEIDYTGLDSCKYLVELNRANGIKMIEAELEAKLPIKDNAFEVVYCREVMEHLSYYETTINEFIRIGQKEIIISWFMKPHETGDEIHYWDGEDLYHNVYNREKLEHYIKLNSKVDKLFWHTISDKENILHILLKEVK